MGKKEGSCILSYPEDYDDLYKALSIAPGLELVTLLSASSLESYNSTSCTCFPDVLKNPNKVM